MNGGFQEDAWPGRMTAMFGGTRRDCFLQELWLLSLQLRSMVYEPMRPESRLVAAKVQLHKVGILPTNRYSQRAKTDLDLLQTFRGERASGKRIW